VNTGDALLRDICEHPEDDTPRLVYADWITDNGDPARGELIRVQCELARLAETDPRGDELRPLAEALLAQNCYRWMRELPWPTGVRWCAKYKHWEGGFARGFVAQAEFSSSKTFRASADAVFGATPLEEVRFKRLTPRTVKSVADSPYLARLRELDVGILTFGTLGELHQPTNELGQIGGVILLSSPHLTRLEDLNLEGNDIGDAGIGALAASPHLGRLRWLRAEANDIGPEGGRALARARLPSLGGLSLSHNRIGDEGVIALAGSCFLAPVTRLWLDGNGLTDAAAHALATSPPTTSLDTLVLSANTLTAAGVRALVQSPYLQRLDTLDVEDNPISPEEAQVLEPEFRGRYFYAGRR
jgi:uncharacterized protein (TIGR02996 family)